jgi:hypothetical protein
MIRANPRAKECPQARQMRWVSIAFAIDTDILRGIALFPH